MSETYKLGTTGIRITPIGLGCWQFAGGKGLGGSYWKRLEPDEVESIVAAALEGGINWFDTAEAYGMGASERSLSAALHSLGVEPGKVVIATKWMPVLRRAVSISRTYETREQCLSPYAIDLHQVHNPASLSSVSAQMDRMADLVDSGRLRAVGVSNFGVDRMKAAHEALARRGLKLASNQVRYSLLDRKIETNGVLDAAKELGITIIAYSPLSQGILTGRFHDDPEAVKGLHGPRKWIPRFKPDGLARTKPLTDELHGIAKETGGTAAQVALAWTIRRNGETVVAIPGASSARQCVSNVAAMALRISREQLDRLDSRSSEVTAAHRKAG